MFYLMWTETAEASPKGGLGWFWPPQFLRLRKHSNVQDHNITAFSARSANLPGGLYILLALIFNDCSENNYLKIRGTDFRNLFTERKRFGCR